MSQASSVAEQLIQAWLRDPNVVRIPHDDDCLRPCARMHPTSDLAIASARTLQGFGALIPVGDGSFMVTWKSEAEERVSPDTQDKGEPKP